MNERPKRDTHETRGTSAARRVRMLLRVFLVTACLLPAGRSSATDPIRVGHYTSSPWGFTTNSFWIEGPSGLILIDTQFLLSAGREAVDVAERYTGKRVVLAIVLHPNPDKFNGTGHLVSRGIRVITSAQVRALIPAVDADRRKSFLQRYRPDYPESLTLPESFGNRTATLRAAGLELTLHVLGRGTSEAHVALQVGDHLFAGDLLANRHHAWLELGLVDDWLATLEALRALKPRYTYPGRGYPADARLIEDQARYLRTVRDIVLASDPSGPLDDSTHERLAARVRSAFPEYGNAYFVNRAVSQLWRDAAATRKTPHRRD